MTSKLTDAARRAAVRVNEDRLWQRLADMGEIGARGDGTMSREALTKADRDARARLAEWGDGLGLSVTMDEQANLFLRLEGAAKAPAVLAGSHLDTQPVSGRFDGAYGVLAALEAAEAIREAGVTLKHPIDVVSWTNEEGCRFAPSCNGSQVWAGTRKLKDNFDDRDAAGIRYGDALMNTLVELQHIPRRPLGGTCVAYIEPHIEQGPVLDSSGVPIGLVTGVQGLRTFSIAIDGETAHAGTTPMRVRKDAFQAAIRAINALNKAMHDPDDTLRFTVGRMILQPNTPNAVPAKAVFSVDLRHPDGAVLSRIGDSIEGIVSQAASPLRVRVEETLSTAPHEFQPAIAERLEKAAIGLGIAHMRLTSGAYHGAVFIEQKCPAGMLFVPCRGGISHGGEEYVAPDHAAAGARVLAAALVELGEPI